MTDANADASPIYSFEVADGRAVLNGVVYSPYFALRPEQVMKDAARDLAYRLEREGLVAGPPTFTQLDNPAKKSEHAFDPTWITGPWHHRYTISAPVSPVE